MSTLLALRLITYLLVGVGVAALLLAGLLDPLGGVILTLALIGSWAIDQVRDRMPVRPIFGWALVTTAAFAIGIDLLYLAQNLLDGMVHLLLFLILLRLFRRRSLKDLRDAGFLSFFMLVAASAVTFNVSFLFVFVAFLVLGTWMLILHHLAGESERAKMGAAELTTSGIGPGSPLFRMSLVAAAGTFALAGVMFFVIPRVGQATLPLRAELGRRIAGFSERVELGSYGEIEADQTVVMRVRFPDSIPEPFRLPNLRWRGLAFDRFDGRVWESGARQRTLLRREASGDFALATPRGTGPIVRQEILTPSAPTPSSRPPRRSASRRARAPSASTTWAASCCPRCPRGFSTRWIPSSSRRRPVACARAHGRWKDRPGDPCASSSFPRCPSASGRSRAT